MQKAKAGGDDWGCAFEGAQILLFSFADCAHIVYSPATCINTTTDEDIYAIARDKEKEHGIPIS